jgi:hypothetical protein
LGNQSKDISLINLEDLSLQISALENEPSESALGYHLWVICLMISASRNQLSGSASGNMPHDISLREYLTLGYHLQEICLMISALGN